ncbi:hypothetical protein [Glycomyces algeriensis]|uniref:Uncharacterized protein n=1 Tax=Glycomyces algeriensis TaxID=256037 RepID=A0A9W6G7D1_9ACTN|nr:hypothetical protein [Glycomyces algeriensis]MDA1366243.1 hypothetical protein [Glycomyces algeriensis]MDR7348989.1 hypothetical protein [Glycomyces algeriensis]GLI41692.1 hypothetical protein GALLR39Z86_15420 [Glycomyces algeriensis]
MKQQLKAVYNRVGRPSPLRVAAVAGVLAVLGLLAVAVFGDQRLVWVVSSLMSLVTLGALGLVWNESRQTRLEARASAERAEVTLRRILAAFEVERLAAERRRALDGDRAA